MDRFQRDLKEKDFIFTFELVPGRSIRTQQFSAILKFIEKAPEYGYFSAFSITDNARGHPALSPVALGRVIKSLGLSAIIHLTCKDKNRNQLESELLALDRENLHNLLVLTGDYPFYGYLGRAKPVFDLDSVLLLQLITEMEKGVEIPKGAPGGGNRLPPIPFFKGCAVSPFKLRIEELWWQYLKLYRKLKAGARFIITQVGFSPFTLYQLKLILNDGFTKYFSERLNDESLHKPEEDSQFKKVPILPSILYLQEPLTKALLRGRVPGILLGRRVWKRFKEVGFSQEMALEVCAKLTAIYQRMGFKGVHLCGLPPNWDLLKRFFELYHRVSQEIINKEETYYELLKEFDDYIVYEDNGELIEKNLANIDKPLPKKSFSFSYSINNFFHNLFFSKKSPLYSTLLKFFTWVTNKRSVEKFFSTLDYAIKRPLFYCQECGDCTLWDFNYICPQSQCAKYILNGACGGSINSFCEVYHYKKVCLYVRVLRQGDPKETIKRYLAKDPPYIPPRDWSLYRTSSWINFYLKRGHFKHEN